MRRRISRRTFLQTSAAAGVLGALRPAFGDDRPMPMRVLGRTGEKVSAVGFGTAQWSRSVPEKTVDRMVGRAIDVGINYIDTAFSYADGDAESHIGKALKGRRDKFFLATKTLPRDRAGAMKELETSLKRLDTDHVDLWQFHSLGSPNDTGDLLRAGGAIEAGEEARKKGMVRFLGITGHGDPNVFADALGRHDFDTLLIPLNCIDPHRLSFEKIALPKAVEKKTGLIAMKVFCSDRLLSDKVVTPEECLRYTLSLQISTCIVGCWSVKHVESMADVARNLDPMTEDERAKLREKTKPLDPGIEWYKSR